jgi:hypothetical protein
MTRIVTTQYRYKRPPKTRKPVVIEVPQVVRAKATRSSGATASVPPTKRKPANDDRKPAVVTAKTPREVQLARQRTEDAELTKDSPRFQRSKPKAIVTSVSRARFPADDDEAATAKWRAYIAKKLRKSDD